MRGTFGTCTAVVLALGLALPGHASAATPGGNGKIVYVEEESELTTRLVLINPDGSGRLPLTTGHFDSDPDWSPSGLRIAFVRYSFETSSEIYAMDGNGSNVVPLTNESGNAAQSVTPAWSPDGTRIAYARFDANDFVDIWIMNANGTGKTQLTFDGASSVPIWSPDGARIHFDSAGDRYSLKPDGSDLKADPIENALCDPEDWFPSMARITCVIVYKQVPPLSELVTVRPDGSNEVTLTGDQTLPGEINESSSVSPDGTKVVFVNSDPYTISPTPSDLYVLKSDGTGTAVNITATIADARMPDWQPSPAYRFSDIASSQFRFDINWLADEGIASGCGSTRYCPTTNVTRGQMASFLARALALPSTATDYFTDDESSIHEPDINLVAAAGIASGCATSRFCPTGLVSREQMASFLARALHLAGSAPDAFTDDETSIHEPNINLVAREGIASGCGGGKYCPAANVTRGQMAAFLHRAFGP